eukprot:TRINITY_DN699_c0_g1_i3.p2 TRINITY_DN699_c0_g1~~TRINITY_DN699_c0_g1_i3.p2  ORF type:complete len:340 (-),score=69.86 TRINITY_DN699_c0_g1_i3:101-1120(-)
MKLHFGDPKKSASLPRTIAPLVILSRNTSALLYPARGAGERERGGSWSCGSSLSHKRSSVATGRGSTGSWRRQTLLRSGMIYLVAVVMVACLPLVVPLAMTQLVQLVDRTQKWAFENRIRQRLTEDLSKSLLIRHGSEEGAAARRVAKARAVSVGVGVGVGVNHSWTAHNSTARAAVRKHAAVALTEPKNNPKQHQISHATYANVDNELIARLEARVNELFGAALVRWLLRQGCKRPQLHAIQLNASSVPVTLEQLQPCGARALCVTRRQRVDARRLTSATRAAAAAAAAVRLTLADSAAMRAAARCDGAALTPQWLTLYELKRTLKVAHTAVAIWWRR